MAEYIEREKVIDDIGELFTLCYETLPNECGHHFIVEKELKTHLDFVRNLPAVDVHPVKHGKWIGRNQKWHCSRCDCPAPKGYRYDFCPYCGADMRQIGIETRKFDVQSQKEG